MTQPHHPLVEAASFLDRTIRLFLSEADTLHAETWILAVARMAGTEMQRSILTAATQEGVGSGRRRFWSRGPRVERPNDSDEGRRLVALLLASLAQLGEPVAEADIVCPPDGSTSGRLSLEQTRARLGALVAACGRTHGLGAGDMAEALTIATALALHQCRDLVPLPRGAGLAVMGLVEGARSAEPLATAA